MVRILFVDLSFESMYLTFFCYSTFSWTSRISFKTCFKSRSSTVLDIASITVNHINITTKNLLNFSSHMNECVAKLSLNWNTHIKFIFRWCFCNNIYCVCDTSSESLTLSAEKLVQRHKTTDALTNTRTKSKAKTFRHSVSVSCIN